MIVHVHRLIARMLLCLATLAAFIVPLSAATPAGASTVGDTAASIALGELGPNHTRGNLENPMNSGCNKYTGALNGHDAICAGSFGNRGNTAADGFAWCSDFATWVWRQAGADVTGLNPGSWSFYTYGQRNGTWHPASSGYLPQPGEAILYDLTTSPLYSSHVGIVVSAANPPDVVQGNWGDANLTNWGVVYDAQSTQAVKYSGKTISGYISPVSSGTPPVGGSGGGGTTSTYPTGTIGPGVSGFSSTTPDASWYASTGHGYAGKELWTFGNGPTSANTATWSSALSAGVYNVQAYIPDDHASGNVTYTVNDSAGSHSVGVNQNVYTNAFANLGNFTLSTNGNLSVVLTDKTSAAYCACLNNEVTADAMKFTYVGAAAPPTAGSSSTLGPGDGGFSSSTPDASWYSGTHGYEGRELWTFGNGPTPSNYAHWNPSLSAGVYDVAVYIPDDHASGSVSYSVADTAGNHVVPVNQNSYTNSFVDLGHFSTGASGSIAVTLSDQTSGGYCACLNNEVTADVVRFTYVSSIASRPNAPAAPSATASTTGSPSATLTWTAPANNGAAIKWYDIQDNHGNYWAGPTYGITGTSFVVPNLAGGTSYQFKVRAYNGYGVDSSGAVGVSDFSALSTAVTPVSVPDVTPQVTAAAGNSSITASWSTPANNGGSPITGYTATTLPGGATCTTTTNSCTVTGLTNGTSYTVTVVAKNLVGSSRPSAAATVTPGTAPSAPTAITVTPGNTSASVSWSAPVNTGGASLSGYTVTASPGGATCTTQTTTCSLSGLLNGTSYTVSVVATNSFNSSPAGTSASFIPGTAADAPSAVLVTPSSGSVSVSWTAPVNTGGVPITGYTVTASPGGATCTTAATSCSVSGLVNGNAYTVSVVAKNSFGMSASAVSATFAPGRASGDVSGASISVAGSSVTVTWRAPESVEGSKIQNYSVTGTGNIVPCVTTMTTCTFTGLTVGLSYTFTIIATNSFGSSAGVAVGPVVVGAPNRVRGITAVQPAKVNGTLRVSWTSGSGAFGSVRYTATVTRGSASKSCSTSGTSCQVTGLAVGHYVVSVVAKSDYGTSLPSTPVDAYVLTAPSAVQGVIVTVSGTSATVFWGAPSSNGGTSPTFLVTTSGNLSCTTTSTTCVITGLKFGATYVFKVVASNGFGASVAAKSVPVKVTRK